MEKTISKVISLQKGKITTTGKKNGGSLEKEYTTASYKTPVKGKQNVSFEGVSGDEVADRVHHGGKDKAVFANSLLNYPRWQKYLGIKSLPFGALAENLTLGMIDEKDVRIGDVHKIGSTVMEVSQPRQPCWKISRRWQNKGFTKYIYDSGETGWYYRVLEEGEIEEGNEVSLLGRAEGQMTIKEANETMADPDAYPDRVESLLNSPVLAEAWKRGLMKKVK